MIRLLIVDDHPAFRRGLELMLSDVDDIEVVAQAARFAHEMPLAAAPVMSALPADAVSELQRLLERRERVETRVGDKRRSADSTRRDNAALKRLHSTCLPS